MAFITSSSLDQESAPKSIALCLELASNALRWPPETNRPCLDNPRLPIGEAVCGHACACKSPTRQSVSPFLPAVYARVRPRAW